MIVCLFNCTTNNVGGGMKNSALFIIETLKNKEGSIKWVYAVSKGVAEILTSKNILLDNSFSVFNTSPSKCKTTRKELLQLSKTSKANLVYTMAGPAYVEFDIKHIQGLSNAYFTHATFKDLVFLDSYFERLKSIVLSKIRLYFAKKADFFIFQTNVAKNEFCKRVSINTSKAFVIPNSYDLEMKNKIERIYSNKPIEINKNKLTIFCPGAAYPHKGFQLIPKIARDMSKLIDGFKFILTLPESKLLNKIKFLSKKYDVEKYIENIGPYNYKDIDILYNKYDIVFVPSLLETFSSTYLEAIVAGKPLIVVNKEFAKEVCEDYAVYVNPFDSLTTAASIVEATNLNNAPSLDVRNRVLKKYGDQDFRFNEIVGVLQTIHNL